MACGLQLEDLGCVGAALCGVAAMNDSEVEAICTLSLACACCTMGEERGRGAVWTGGALCLISVFYLTIKWGESNALPFASRDNFVSRHF